MQTCIYFRSCTRVLVRIYIVFKQADVAKSFGASVHAITVLCGMTMYRVQTLAPPFESFKFKADL